MCSEQFSLSSVSSFFKLAHHGESLCCTPAAKPQIAASWFQVRSRRWGKVAHRGVERRQTCDYFSQVLRSQLCSVPLIYLLFVLLILFAALNMRFLRFASSGQYLAQWVERRRRRRSFSRFLLLSKTKVIWLYSSDGRIHNFFIQASGTLPILLWNSSHAEPYGAFGTERQSLSP